MHSSIMRTARSGSRLLGGSASVHAGIPSKCGPGDPQARTPHLRPWVWAWRPPRHAGIPPPETCKACWDTTCNAWWDTTSPLP